MTEEALHRTIKVNRRRNRDAVASALMLALSGAITPADSRTAWTQLMTMRAPSTSEPAPKRLVSL